MVRHANWLPTISLGLLFAWQALPAASQQLLLDDASPVDSSPVSGFDAPYSNEFDANAKGTGGEVLETIKERYPDGSIKVERQVTQDAHGNYINHGPWKMFDQKGRLMAQGEYQHGNRTGEWIRWYRSVTESALLSKAPYQAFAGPFVSQATFTDGDLDGVWTIFDGKMHKISQFNFVNGRRHGQSTLWYPNGRPMREVEFRDGVIDGTFIERNPEGHITVNDTYQDGRKLAKKTAHHNGGAKKSEGTYLFAREIEQTPDDWWTCKLLTTTKTGKDEKHGPWVSWHGNGQKQMEGTYEHDLQTGKFTWWHPNGQKALEGNYTEGKQDGEWTWWYDTGQKSISGEYALGNPTGRWTWWKEDGKVSQSADLSLSEGVVIDMPKSLEKPAPRASRPLPRQPVR